MNLEIPADEIDLILKALEHYDAYTAAKNADTRYRDLAERLKRKPTEREAPAQPGKASKRRA